LHKAPSGGVNLSQMPCRYPSEVRRQVVELARAGTRVKQLAKTFSISEATIYSWLKQDRIDRGELEGLSTDQAIELAAPDAGSGSLRPSWRSRARSTKCFSSRGCPQKALPGDQVPGRAGQGHRCQPRVSRVGRYSAAGEPGCCFRLKLSHKSRPLEKFPTSSRMWCRPPRLCANQSRRTPAHRQAVGECHNERPSTRTYATATRGASASQVERQTTGMDDAQYSRARESARFRSPWVSWRDPVRVSDARASSVATAPLDACRAAALPRSRMADTRSRSDWRASIRERSEIARTR
jgi:hypothetical protein